MLALREMELQDLYDESTKLENDMDEMLNRLLENVIEGDEKDT